jgi:hypothetical protein
VSSAQRAFLYDVEKAELQQTIGVETSGQLRYVDVSEQHIFIVSILQLNVYDRANGSCVLSIPAGRLPWGFYAKSGEPVDAPKASTMASCVFDELRLQIGPTGRTISMLVCSSGFHGLQLFRFR